MIDLSNLQEECEFESIPDFDVELPRKNNPSLNLYVESEHWESIVRFGERKIISELIKTGKGTIYEQGNPYFNGCVNLRAKCTSISRGKLQEKLDVLKERLLYQFSEFQGSNSDLHDEPITLDFTIE